MMTQANLQTLPTLGQLLPEVSLLEAALFPVGPLVLDSRQVSSGDTFIALPGSQHDGRRFIDNALQQGASLILTEQETSSEVTCQALANGIQQVAIPALRQRVSEMAARWFGNPSSSIKVVGITGTNGKTTCSQWLAQLLSSDAQPAGTVGTLGYGRVGQPLIETGMTTPDAVATQQILSILLGQGVESVAMEVSSHSLDQGRVSAVDIDVAVFTNIGRDHLDYHGDMASYVASKTALMSFQSLKAAVVNRDDPCSGEFIAKLSPAVSLLTYGLQGNGLQQDSSQENLDFTLRDVHYLPDGVTATLISPEGEFDLSLAIWGEFNLRNILAVIASAYALGYPMADLVVKLADLTPVSGRLEPVTIPSDITVLIDFAHTADALTSVLSAVRQHSSQRLWCVFGCGGDRDKGKRPIMAAAAEAVADRIVVTSDNPRTEDPQTIIDEVMTGFERPQQVTALADRHDAIQYAIQQAESGDCIVIAGKGHEDYQQVGTEKRPFSDMNEAQLAVTQRRVEKGGLQQ